MSRYPWLTLLILLSPLAQAATFAVDTSSDDGGAAFQACTAAPEDCSLRGAILRANAAADADTIGFDLPVTDAGYQAATAHWRISPATALPDIQTGPLTLDGFTQPGAVPNTNPAGFPLGHALKIELHGPNPSNTNGLQALFVSLTVRGLVLNNWNQAIYLFEVGSHVIEGNHIGTDVSGQVAVPNRFGVALGGDVRIGGSLPAQGNVISGNQRGALVQFRQLTRLRVQGNTIGPNDTQTAVVGIQDYGVSLTDHTDAVIGGAALGEGNVIAGNAFNAIIVSGNPQAAAGAAQTRILGNVIGATFSGAAMGNGLNPSSPSQPLPTIQIGRLGYCRVDIGGTAPGEGNLIAFGGQAGVAIGACWSAPILGNAFLGNRGLPIDLAGSNNYDGATANDAGDGDGSGTDPFGAGSFGNRYQNTAEIMTQVEDSNADELRLTLRVDTATTSAVYPLRIDFYRMDGFDILQPAVTETYAGTDAQQPREYVLTLSQFAKGGRIVVTDAEGNSSEMIGFGDVFKDGFED